jgi:GNAT superfamily N-acetyltransferase
VTMAGVTSPRRPLCSFRAASPADVDAITALVAAAYQHYVPRIGFEPRPMQADYAEVVRTRSVTLAEVGSELVGVLVVLERPEEFLVENVAVHPDHHGQGIGSALLTRAESWAREAGHAEVRLYTHEKMTENRRLYEHRGYVEYVPPNPIAPDVVHLRKPLFRTGSPTG